MSKHCVLLTYNKLQNILPDECLTCTLVWRGWAPDVHSRFVDNEECVKLGNCDISVIYKTFFHPKLGWNPSSLVFERGLHF